MAIVYLIRHAQASFGSDNYDQLSSLGQLQSARLGLALRDRMGLFDAVYLGTMKRQRQTAENCLSAYGATLNDVNAVFDESWNEYDFQEILGKYNSELETPEGLRAYIKAHDDPKNAFEEEFGAAIDRWIQCEDPSEYSESWLTYTTRVHGALEDVFAKTAHTKKVAVFTSGGPISLITQSLLGIEQERIMKMNWTLLNCGVTKVVSTDSRVFVASLNDHSHFEGEGYKRFLTYT